MYEYVPGEKVTLDTATGNYWYWDVSDFTNMTYDQQISAIAALGNYGNIADGWHMATLEDITQLWEYDADELLASFNPTLVVPVSLSEIRGRYDYSSTSGYHYRLLVSSPVISGLYKDSLQGAQLLDTATAESTFPVGTWVVSEGPVIPVPGALVLAAIGLLSSLPGINRLRCRSNNHRRPDKTGRQRLRP